MPKLIDGDRVATSQEDKQVMHNFYENLIGKVADRSFSLNLHSFHRAASELSMLDSPITEEEV